jgi:hypothetical protein
MKVLDLLDQFDKGEGAFGFIATYEFDPQFFERRVLAKRTFGSADRLVVFMDIRKSDKAAGLIGPGHLQDHLDVR